jgi:uncharacterized sodium:solute symporter family permease YidK
MFIRACLGLFPQRMPLLVCAYVLMDGWMDGWMLLHLYVWMLGCMHMYECMNEFDAVPRYPCISLLCAGMYAPSYVCMCTYVCMDVYVFLYACMLTYVCMDVHVCGLCGVCGCVCATLAVCLYRCRVRI